MPRLLPLLLLGCLTACEARRLVIPSQDTGAGFEAEPCPRLHVSDGSLNWEGVSIDGTPPQTVAITNLCSGEGDLVMVPNLMPQSSSAFGFVVGETTLEPGASTVLVASFSPDDLEHHSGLISLDSNADAGDPQLISLTGQAAADGDGDGFEAASLGGEDCDDSDPEIHPDAQENWSDGVDNDCDGIIDQLGPEDAVAWLRGDPEQLLGYRSSLAVADVTGDGVLDIVAGGMFTGTRSESQGAVRVLDGTAYTDFAGSIDGYELALIQGAAAESRTGTLDPEPGDQDGDGVHDLFLVSSDVINADDGNKAGALYLGGSGLTGQLGPDDAALTLSGSDSLTSITGLNSIDFDGDGLDDLFVGDWYSGQIFTGRVYGFLAASVQEGGDRALQWAHDQAWYGDTGDDRLGCALSGGDLDGDGYDDLLMSSPHADVGGAESGSLFAIRGRAEPDDGGVAEESYDLQIHGTSAGARLGWLARSQIADFDGDGRADLAVSTPSLGTVHVWLDAEGIGGVVAATTADLQILGEGADLFGQTLAQADADGDGITDLVVGAPDHAEPIEAWADADERGEVYVFTQRSLTAGELGSSQATVVVGGVSEGDLFGLSLCLGDLSGDGQAELLVAAPAAGSSQQGTIWIFDGR